MEDMLLQHTRGGKNISWIWQGIIVYRLVIPSIMEDMLEEAIYVMKEVFAKRAPKNRISVPRNSHMPSFADSNCC